MLLNFVERIARTDDVVSISPGSRRVRILKDPENEMRSLGVRINFR